MPHPLNIAKDIGWALYHAHQRGETPVAIVVDAPTRDWMRNHEIGDWWSPQPTLFDLPVEVDTRGGGWRVRATRPAAGALPSGPRSRVS